MAEYEVLINYMAGDNGYVKVTFDVDAENTMVSLSEGEVSSAVANAVAGALTTLIAEENVTDVSTVAKRYFNATENIALT